MSTYRTSIPGANLAYEVAVVLSVYAHCVLCCSTVCVCVCVCTLCVFVFVCVCVYVLLGTGLCVPFGVLTDIMYSDLGLSVS